MAHRAGVGQPARSAIYDKEGQLVTGSMMDYTMPRAHDLPSFHSASPKPNPVQPARIKGCAGRCDASPPAVINAITDAIDPRSRNAATAIGVVGLAARQTRQAA